LIAEDAGISWGRKGGLDGVGRARKTEEGKRPEWETE